MHAVRDYRAVAVRSRWDEQWLRLLDLDRALAARSYSDGPAVVIEVTPHPTDDERPHPDRLAGRWRIDAGGAARTDAAADLVTTIDGISAAYLGATSWASLTAVGVAQAVDRPALERADARFAVHPLAFSGTYF